MEGNIDKSLNQEDELSLKDSIISAPSLGICSGGFDFPAKTECEYLYGPYEHPGYTIRIYTKNWYNYFQWPSGSGGKMTILQNAIYKIHFQSLLFESSNAFVKCSLKLIRDSVEGELYKTYTRIDNEMGVGNVELTYECQIKKNDRIRITIESDKDIHGAPTGEYSQLYIQLIGLLP